jgi:membrane dipeptidase
MRKRIVRWLFRAVLIVVGVQLGLGLLALLLGRFLNAVVRRDPVSPSDQVRALHREQTLVDLHADTLLWDRSVLERSSAGAVDVPRLLEGNVALQVFGVVTQTPWGMNNEKNSDRSDMNQLLSLAQRWPPRTWGSPLERAKYQAHKLEKAARESGGKLRLIRTRAELESLLQARAQGTRVVGGLLGLEGAHTFEGRIESLEVLFAAGFRMIGLAHFFDNAVAGSTHGEEKGGLTPLGRTAVEKMESMGVTVDLAHTSELTVTDVLAMASRPVVVSHTGVKGTCDNRRNLSDAQLQAIARNGGVVGIGFWNTATCGNDVSAIARAVVYAAKVAGEDHVALGSDFDGAVRVPLDASQLAELTDALLRAGLPRSVLPKILGGNALRVLRANLPP